MLLLKAEEAAAAAAEEEAIELSPGCRLTKSRGLVRAQCDEALAWVRFEVKLCPCAFVLLTVRRKSKKNKSEKEKKKKKKKG